MAVSNVNKVGIVINVPRPSSAGASKLVPVDLVEKLNPLVGLKGEGLKSSTNWAPNASLPDAVRAKADQSTAAYQFVGQLPGLQSGVYAVTFPDGGNGTNIKLFDVQGTELSHVETNDDAGYVVEHAAGDSFANPAPAAPAPGIVVHVPVVQARSASDLITWRAVFKLTQSVGTAGAGLGTKDWPQVTDARTLPASVPKLDPGALAYKFAGDLSTFGDASKGDVFVTHTPSQALGVDMEMYDATGVHVAHVEKDDVMPWSIIDKQ
jgi:hypothetical protein